MLFLFKLEIYQWLAPLIGLYFIYRTISQYIKKKRTIVAAVVWILFWVSIITLAIIPNQVTNKIAAILGFKSNVTAIIFVAIGLLFLFIFYLSSAIEKLENQLTELVRKIAIDEHSTQRKKQKSPKK